jgi:hypothetical protein
VTDAHAIEQVVRHWALCRDTRQWEGLRRCYAPGASVKTTWMVGSADDFIAASIKGAGNPNAPQSLHSIGASSIEVLGDKALAETRMVLMLRAPLDGVEVDITAWGRFLDFFVRHQGRWCIHQRHPIHEKDRIDPVDPAAVIKLDAARLARLPKAYCHITYMQSLQGATITPDLVQHNSPEQALLYQAAQDWLRG